MQDTESWASGETGVASTFIATRDYADGATRALLLLYGADAEAQVNLEGAFRHLGAREEDPEVALPLDLEPSGFCVVHPDGVDLTSEGFTFSCIWGATSTWWQEVADTDDAVYVGLLGEAQRAVLPVGLDPASRPPGDRLFPAPLPTMPFLRFGVRLA